MIKQMPGILQRLSDAFARMTGRKRTPVVHFSQAEILTLLRPGTPKQMNASLVIHVADGIAQLVDLMDETPPTEPSFARSDLKGALTRWSQSLNQDSFQQTFSMPEEDFRLIARHMDLIQVAAYHYLEKSGQNHGNPLVKKIEGAGTPNVYRMPVRHFRQSQTDPEARPKADALMHFYLHLKELVEPKLAALPPRPENGFVWKPEANIK